MISTVNDLNERFEALSKSLNDKIKGADGMRHIVLCGGTGCLSAHSTEIMERFKAVLKEKGIENKATVNQVGCFGFCSQGPFVKIYPEDTLYKMVKIEDVDEIVEKDIIGGEIVDRLLYVDPKTQEKVTKQDDILFYKKQRRVALNGCGVINPEDINEDYISNNLDTKDIPDPDLLIRTSGELRISNFLLWQIAYSEFYFADCHWPDFNKDELIKAIEAYNKRDRRFGDAK